MSAPASKLLDVKGLTKRYGTVTVVDDCSMTFRAGEIHALLGANGAGKSTLVRMISGLVKPSAGTMQLAGKSLIQKLWQRNYEHQVQKRCP